MTRAEYALEVSTPSAVRARYLSKVDSRVSRSRGNAALEPRFVGAHPLQAREGLEAVLLKQEPVEIEADDDVGGKQPLPAAARGG